MNKRQKRENLRRTKPSIKWRNRYNNSLNESPTIWNPKDYSRSSSAQSQWADELVGRLELTGNESILDIGCGDGSFTAKLARLAPAGSVLGIDSSSEMIAHAESTFPPKTYPNLQFIVTDAQGLKFNQQFDRVFSNATLHWIQDHCLVFKNICSSLKKGGKAVTSCGGKGNGRDLLAAINKVTSSSRWCDYFDDFKFPWYFYGPEDYDPWFKETGLKVVRMELVSKDMLHQSNEELGAWIRTTWMPYTHRIPETHREEFIAKIMQEYLIDHPVDSKGCTHVQMVRFETELIKIG